VGHDRIDPDKDEWVCADSIWRLIGYEDFTDNCYTPGIMAETLDQLFESLTWKVTL
jgi:hypothetical protein